MMKLLSYLLAMILPNTEAEHIHPILSLFFLQARAVIDSIRQASQNKHTAASQAFKPRIYMQG